MNDGKIEQAERVRAAPPTGGVYGKLAAGGQLSMGDFEKTTLRPAWQIVPVGLQWGGEKVFGLAEMGYGNVYLVRIGMGIRW